MFVATTTFGLDVQSAIFGEVGTLAYQTHLGKNDNWVSQQIV